MSEYVTTTSDEAIFGLKLISGETAELRLHSEDGTTETLLHATRADFGETSPTGETTEAEKMQGQEIFDAGQIYAKVGAGAWQNICGYANKIDLGAISAAGSVDFSLKVETVGQFDVCGFGLKILAR